MSNSRVVVLRGTTTSSQLFSPNFFDLADWIREWLTGRGFDVIAVRMSAAGWLGYSNNIEIELNVNNEYTSEEARVNAIREINSITANSGFNYVFSNTTLNVVSDAYVPPGGGGLYQLPPIDGGTVYANPPSSYNQQPGVNGNPPAPPASTGGSDFLASLGLGAGISTPIALIGGAVVLLLVLRK